MVAGLRDTTGASTLPVLLALRRRDESLPIIVSVPLTQGGMRDVSQAIATGLEVSWVIEDAKSLAYVVARAVALRLISNPAGAILRGVLRSAPPEVRGFLAISAIGALRPLNVQRAAHALGLAERTLERQLDQARLPSPHRILGWCRLLHAAWHFEVLDQRPKQVVHELCFSSVPALYRLFGRYAAPTPRALRAQGGFADLLRRFIEEVDCRRNMLPRRDGDAERGPRKGT